MRVRLSPQAESELDDIWYYTATESSSIEIAQRLLDAITDRFALLSNRPFLGRRRDDLKIGLRSVVVSEYVIIYRVEDESILILHVLHGRRDIRSIVQ